MRGSNKQLLNVPRRRILHTAAGITTLGVLGNNAAMTAAAEDHVDSIEVRFDDLDHDRNLMVETTEEAVIRGEIINLNPGDTVFITDISHGSSHDTTEVELSQFDEERWEFSHSVDASHRPPDDEDTIRVYLNDRDDNQVAETDVVFVEPVLEAPSGGEEEDESEDDVE